MWILIIGLCIDQISKFLVCHMTEKVQIFPNLLTFEYVENRGAIFGVMQGSNFGLAIISAIVCVCLLIYLYRKKLKQEKVHFAWYLILTGGIGNLIDRMVRGYVVDFIATPFIATFNIADSFVVIGVGILFLKECIDGMKQIRERKEQGKR